MYFFFANLKHNDDLHLLSPLHRIEGGEHLFECLISLNPLFMLVRIFLAVGLIEINEVALLATIPKKDLLASFMNAH